MHSFVKVSSHEIIPEGALFALPGDFHFCVCPLHPSCEGQSWGAGQAASRGLVLASLTCSLPLMSHLATSWQSHLLSFEVIPVWVTHGGAGLEGHWEVISGTGFHSGPSAP